MLWQQNYIRTWQLVKYHLNSYSITTTNKNNTISSSSSSGGMVVMMMIIKLKLCGLSPRAKYTDRATTACRQSYCQLLRIEGTTWSA
jgi:hypothetical protein